MTEKQHLSFSGWSTFKSCPFKYKIEYLIAERTPLYTIHLDFGSAIHKAFEVGVRDETRKTELFPIFERTYDKLVTEGRKHNPENYEVDDDEWKGQAKTIIAQLYEYLDKEFPGWKLVSTEEDIYEPIEGTEWFFKGFIDFVFEYKGKAWIVDWKTTTWGWKRNKKQDPMILRQVQLYKYFWCKKYGVEPKDVNCTFVLLKRTPKKNNIELVRASGSLAKIEEAAKDLRSATKAIDKKLFLKNRFSCSDCTHYGTELCP